MIMRRLWKRKKDSARAASLPSVSGCTGGQPQRRQGVAGFAGNWAGVPRSHHAGGRSSKPWRVQRVLPAVEECLGAIQKKPSILVLEMCAAHPGSAAACCSSGESGIACPPSLQRRRAASPTALAREKPHKTLGCPPRSRLHWGKRQQAARSPRTPSQARFKSA